MAQGFWSILIPHGLLGGALSHTNEDEEQDDAMEGTGDEEGWKPEYLQWWFEFLEQKGTKAINQDTWKMVSCTCHAAKPSLWCGPPRRIVPRVYTLNRREV